MTTPRETIRVAVQVPAPLLRRIDQLAANAGLTRSGAVLLSVSACLDPATRTVTTIPTTAQKAAA